MTETPYVPHITLLLRALGLGRDELDAHAMLAVPAAVLRKLLETLAAAQPFDAAFYLERYPDLAEAHRSGRITDLHRHFVEVGYLEGRAGSLPAVDEAFYTRVYPDVAQAIARGDMPSAAEHFLRAGMAEGRVPTVALLDAVDGWFRVLRGDVRG